MNVFRYIRKDPIRLALAVSLVLHAAALFKLPAFRKPPEPQTAPSGPLIVQLAPRAVPPARPPQRSAPAQRPSTPAAPPRAAERPRPPPVIARSDPAPAAVPAPRPAPPAPAVPAPPASGDLTAYVEARRRARGEDNPAPAASPAPARSAAGEDANARANRIAAANLGLGRKPTFGPDRRSGGVFDITYTSYEYAEFVFYGWNKEIRRDTSQKIEVRRGPHPDIKIAIIRRMIGIIREHETEDFTWESIRLGRDVTLSARARDQAGLENFLFQEFFATPPPTRR